MIEYVEAATLKQLAKAANNTGGTAFGSPVPTILAIGEHGQFVTVTGWAQGVTIPDRQAEDEGGAI